jgi:3-oxoacyl-[acyl-carrier protein] reductase
MVRPAVGPVALVTGAARGIGAAIVDVLARDGATIICLDVPSASDDLAAVTNAVGGSAIQLDLTAPDATGVLVDFVSARHGQLDIVVHNAGITRDKTIANMTVDQWESVLDVNLIAPLRVNSALLDANLIPAGGRIIEVSSVTGIAGNRGQTNYATSKAGVIGAVEAQAALLAEHGITINAVAPGFIETAMTAAMPLFLREAGRRMNSLSQGGLPVDVAETIAWLAAPGSGGVTGNVVRVCGQSLLGA